MFTNYMLDAVQSIANAYIFYFICLLLMPLISAGIGIYNLIKEYKRTQSEIPVYDCSGNNKNVEYDRNMLIMIYNKVKNNEPLSPEDKRILNRYNIKY